MGLRSQRPRRRWLITALILALLAGGTAAAFVLGSSQPAAAVTLPDPPAVGRSIVAAALGQQSVHWTSAGSDSGMASPGRRWRTTSDVTANAGVQRITITYLRRGGAFWNGRAWVMPPRGGPVKAAIRLVGDAVYVMGNVAALERMALGLTHAQAVRYAGRWISIPKWRDPLTGHAPLIKLPAELTLGAIVENELKWATSSISDDASDTEFLDALRKPNGTQEISFADDGSDEVLAGEQPVGANRQRAVTHHRRSISDRSGRTPVGVPVIRSLQQVERAGARDRAEARRFARDRAQALGRAPLAVACRELRQLAVRQMLGRNA